MASGMNDAPLLESADAAAGTTIAGAAALANLDKDQGTVRLTHDQINFAPAAAGRAKIRGEPMQAVPLQMRSSQGLGLIATPLGRQLPAARRFRLAL